ncbi:MAG: hypothetical protein JWM85_3603 [Acidimicrobiaceae bacterium]|nr:hypothetical protein [Acidimicrobiaceae bacterium]
MTESVRCGWVPLGQTMEQRCVKTATTIRQDDLVYFFCEDHAAEFDAIIAAEQQGQTKREAWL